MRISLEGFDETECKELIDQSVVQFLKNPKDNESLHIFVKYGVIHD